MLYQYISIFYYALLRIMDKKKQVTLAFSTIGVIIIFYAVGAYASNTAPATDNDRAALIFQLFIVPAILYSAVILFIVKRWFKLVPILVIVFGILAILAIQMLKAFS
jgi:CHASE2 domain-containing sensor protein